MENYKKHSIQDLADRVRLATVPINHPPPDEDRVPTTSHRLED